MYEFDTIKLGIACDPEKVLKRLELGAKAGDIGSRHVLGLKEYERGNRAVSQFGIGRFVPRSVIRIPPTSSSSAIRKGWSARGN